MIGVRWVRTAVWALVATALVVGAGSAAGGVRAEQATAKAPAPPQVVLRNFHFVGLESDVVGRGFGLPGQLPRNPKPNGDRDGHFSVILATPTRALTLYQIILQRPPKGKQLGPGAWSTATDRGPALGAVLGGKRMNPDGKRFRVQLPRSNKDVRLDLYLNDEGQFLPRQRYQVLVQTSGAGDTQKRMSASKWLTIPGGAATMTASLVGRGEDRIGSLAISNLKQPDAPAPDGLPDAHFGALLDTHGAWRIMSNIVVQHIDAQGNGIGQPGNEHCRSAVTQELAANGWSSICSLLLVDGQTITTSPDFGKGPEGPDFVKKPGPGNTPRCSPRGEPPTPQNPNGSCVIYVPLRPSAQPRHLDVYVNDPDPGLALSGQRFRLTVYFSDYPFGIVFGPPGSISATVRIP